MVGYEEKIKIYNKPVASLFPFSSRAMEQVKMARGHEVQGTFFAPVRTSSSRIF